jgi:hypothetical protein
MAITGRKKKNLYAWLCGLCGKKKKRNLNDYHYQDSSDV